MKKKIKDNETENTVHNIEESSEIGEKELREKRLKRRKRQRFWDRVAGFIIVTGLVVGCACLTLEYIIVKGPSPALRDMFISTMDETRRFKFIPQIFLTADELK